MLLNSPLQESKRREAALKIIDSKIKNKDRTHLYDLTGLSGGFPLKKEDIELLETYAGPAIFEEKLQPLGLEHLGGEKVLALNRTSSGILATILALVKSKDQVVHYLPQLPSHPIIPRSLKLIDAQYTEYDHIEDFKITDKTVLTIITGSTMDHQIIRKEDFLKVVEISHDQNIPVLVDDASGARLRTILYEQPRAMDMGADIVITSTDKLMEGPRGGLMSGKEGLIDLIKSKAYQYGLEAQPPLIAGMVRALEQFSPERIIKSQEKKEEIFQQLKKDFQGISKTPTGVMLKEEDLMREIEYLDKRTSLDSKEAAQIMAMILLREHDIITIPAVGMPGASSTLRLDMASKDAERVDVDHLTQAFHDAFGKLTDVLADEQTCRDILFN
ncbi:MAG: TIGR03576 family pyridoxal phosphate-dependent enzyme [Methanobacterium sp.]|nr:TIGR03576 family pyridoxal phosphate-dependent enzyme [Methanobacterium sp.]